MRRIVAFERVSLAGEFADEGGQLDWATPEPEIDRMAAQGGDVVDTFVFGRKTYEMMASFWPHAEKDGSVKDPHTGQDSPEMAAMARTLNRCEKIVFSRELEQASWGPARIVRSIERKEIAHWKQQPGKDMLVLGSGSIVNALIELELLDELQLVYTPVILAGGRPLVPPGQAKKAHHFSLLEAKAYPHGNVMIRYGRPRY